MPIFTKVGKIKRNLLHKKMAGGDRKKSLLFLSNSGNPYSGSIDYYSRKDALLSMESDLGGVRGVTGASLDFWLEAFYDWTAATTNSTYTPYITAGKRR